MGLVSGRKGTPILTYHSIDDSHSVISVSLSDFKKQMAYLKRKRYKTLSLSELVRAISQREPIPERSIAITFDDGYRNNYTHALPVLVEYGFTATVFVPTRYCGGMNCWPNQHPSIPSLRMLSWEEMKRMESNGIEFGSHSQTHLRLTELSLEMAEKEILGSKMDMENHLGKPVEFFSYPYGDFNEPVRGIAKSVFRGAISNRSGKVTPNSDRYALERINAASGLFKVLPANPMFFSSFDLYLTLKMILDRFRALKKER